MAVDATLTTLWNAVVRRVGGVAWFAFANTREHAFPVRATFRTFWIAFVARVEAETRFTLADTRSDAFAVDASCWTGWNAGFPIVRRITVPFVATAYTRSSALSVTATVLADGYTLFRFDSGAFRGRPKNVSRFAPAHARCHAVAVSATAWTNRFALACYFVVA